MSTVLSHDTLRKIRLGHILLCTCGHTHSGKYPTCIKCRSKECNNCGIKFTGENKNTCRACIKRKEKSIKLI